MSRLPSTGVALALDGVTQRFGGLVALDDVSFSVADGAIHGVIGPNGAGKTTMLNVLSGLQRPTAGHVLLHGVDVSRWRAHRLVVDGGLVRTFQTVRLFATMTVREHLYLAGRRMHGRGSEGDRAAARAAERLGLEHVLDAPAASLAYGLQRRVELARALASSPNVLLLDEPAAGLNPQERAQLGSDIRSLASEGITVVLVEHHMDLVQSVCERTIVLDFGAIICDAPMEEAMAAPEVLSAYLGSAGTL